MHTTRVGVRPVRNGGPDNEPNMAISSTGEMSFTFNPIYAIVPVHCVDFMHFDYSHLCSDQLTSGQPEHGTINELRIDSEQRYESSRQP